MISLRDYIAQVNEAKLANIKDIFNSVQKVKSMSNSKDVNKMQEMVDELKEKYGDKLNIDETEDKNGLKKYAIRFAKGKLEDLEFVLAVKTGRWDIAVEKGSNILKRISGMWKKTAKEAMSIIKSDKTISEKTSEGLKFYFKSLIDYSTYNTES